MKSEKDNAFDSAIALIRKSYGQDAIQDMDGDKMNQFKVDFVSTGCLSLDRVLGGGLPRGRVIEVFGAPSSGKSVLATFLMAQMQRLGERAVLVDSEFAFSPEFAQKVGLNVDALQLVQAPNAEEALDIVAKLVSASAVSIIVVDSVASLVPKDEVEGTVFDQNMALQARILSKSLRILTGSISKSKTIVIFINQTRDRVGVFYGPKTTTSGGNALKFYSSVRIEIKKGKNLVNEKDEVIGNWIGVNVVKNKVSPPFKTCDLELIYERGLDLVGDVLDSALKSEILTRQGNSVYYGEEKMGGGRDQAKKFLEDPANEKIYEKLFKELTKK